MLFLTSFTRKPGLFGTADFSDKHGNQSDGPDYDKTI